MYAYCLNILGQKENGSFIGLKKRLKIDPSINNDFGCNSPAGTNKKIRPSLSFDEDLSLAASGGGGKWQRLLAALEMDFGVGLAAGRGPEPLVAEFALVGQRTGVESHVDLNEVDLTVKIFTSRD